MHIYIFLSLSTPLLFTLCLAIQTVSVEGLAILATFGPLGFSPCWLNPYCSFDITRIFVLLFFWMISWSWLALSMLTRDLEPSCASWITYLFFQAWILSYTAVFFFRTVLRYSGHGCLFAIWQIYWNPEVGSCFVTWATCYSPSDYILFGKTILCGSGRAQLCQLCCIIQSYILDVYNSPALLFLYFNLSLPVWCQLQWLSELQQCPVPFWFSLPDTVIATDSNPIIGPFIFRVLGFPYPVVASGLVPCMRCILPSKNSWLLQLLHKMVFWLSSRVVAFHLD